jgi:uncharacterized protein (DUF2461 family)
MKKVLFFLLLSAVFFPVYAQPEGRAIVEKLCGCFQVDFKYAETFSSQPDYKYHDREETGGTAELALPIEVSDKKIVIQHLLIVGEKMVVKHWREEWTYENPVIWKYKGERTWVKETLSANEVKGKWTQTVWEVADEPRYQGFSQFVNLDNRTIWQNTTDAPLPRREYSVRSDYNILKRTNRLNITDSGYLHEQDNQKILRTNSTDQLLVEEKGQNIYKRIAEKECNAAKAYWEKNSDYWNRVRKIWAGYTDTYNSISLKSKVEGKMLHEYLIALGNEFEIKKVNEREIDDRITNEIKRFIGKEGYPVADMKEEKQQTQK